MLNLTGIQQAIKFANKKAAEPDPNLYLSSVKFETATRLRFRSDDMIKALSGVRGDGLVLLADETGAYTHNLYARHLVDLCKLYRGVVIDAEFLPEVAHEETGERGHWEYGTNGRQYVIDERYTFKVIDKKKTLRLTIHDGGMRVTHNIYWQEAQNDFTLWLGLSNPETADRSIFDQYTHKITAVYADDNVFMDVAEVSSMIKGTRAGDVVDLFGYRLAVGCLRDVMKGAGLLAICPAGDGLLLVGVSTKSLKTVRGDEDVEISKELLTNWLVVENMTDEDVDTVRWGVDSGNIQAQIVRAMRESVHGTHEVITQNSTAVTVKMETVNGLIVADYRINGSQVDATVTRHKDNQTMTYWLALLDLLKVGGNALVYDVQETELVAPEPAPVLMLPEPVMIERTAEQVRQIVRKVAQIKGWAARPAAILKVAGQIEANMTHEYVNTAWMTPELKQVFVGELWRLYGEYTAVKSENEMDAVNEAIDRLADCGIVAMYGGGDESKGHGFWLRQTNPEDAKRRAAWWRQAGSMTNEQYLAERRHWEEGTPLVNDGEKSGNPHFWMFDDALALTATIAPGDPAALLATQVAKFGRVSGVWQDNWYAHVFCTSIRYFDVEGGGAYDTELKFYAIRGQIHVRVVATGEVLEVTGLSAQQTYEMVVQHIYDKDREAWPHTMGYWVDLNKTRQFVGLPPLPAPDNCQHPPARLYAWEAGGVMCVGCCECGQVLAGAAS